MEYCGYGSLWFVIISYVYKRQEDDTDDNGDI